jgi:hypothetical protein
MQTHRLQQPMHNTSHLCTVLCSITKHKGAAMRRTSEKSLYGYTYVCHIRTVHNTYSYYTYGWMVYLAQGDSAASCVGLLPKHNFMVFVCSKRINNDSLIRTSPIEAAATALRG